ALLFLLSPLSLSLYLSSLLPNSADPTSAASLLAHAFPAHPASNAGPLWSSSSLGRRRGPSAELQLARPTALAHGGARPACSPRRRAVRRRVVAPTASTQRGEFNGGRCASKATTEHGRRRGGGSGRRLACGGALARPASSSGPRRSWRMGGGRRPAQVRGEG
ncbi:hypothetical protein PVAP13_9KG409625, partial [Panicum virgatum]